MFRDRLLSRGADGRYRQQQTDEKQINKLNYERFPTFTYLYTYLYSFYMSFPCVVIQTFPVELDRSSSTKVTQTDDYL